MEVQTLIAPDMLSLFTEWDYRDRMFKISFFDINPHLLSGADGVSGD